MSRRTVYHLTWTMRWLNRQPPNHDEPRLEGEQPPAQPLVIVIIHESWTLRWADEGEVQPLLKDTE